MNGHPKEFDLLNKETLDMNKIWERYQVPEMFACVSSYQYFYTKKIMFVRSWARAFLLGDEHLCDSNYANRTNSTFNSYAGVQNLNPPQLTGCLSQTC